MESRESVQLSFNYKVFKPITARIQEAKATAEEISLYLDELKLLRQTETKLTFAAAINHLKLPHSFVELNNKYNNLKKLTEKEYFFQENINTIAQELKDVYKIELTKSNKPKHNGEKHNGEVKYTEEHSLVELDDDEILDLTNKTFYPRALFLLERYLVLKSNQQQALATAENNNLTFKHNFFHQLRTSFKRYFNVFKKVIDGTDDGYAALRNVPALKYSAYQDLLNLLTPILVGSVGVIINSAEAVLGYRRARKAALDPRENRQKLTRIWTGRAAAVLGSTGTTFASLSIFAGITGLTLGGFAPLLPFLVPCFPFIIYAIELGRKSYTLNRTQAREYAAKLEYDNFIAGKHVQLKIQDKLIHEQENKLAALQDKIKKLDDEKLALIKKKSPVIKKIWAIKAKEIEYHAALEELKQLKKDDDIQEALRLKQYYETCRFERLKAERKVSMNVVELLGTTLVVTGVGLGTAAIFGAASVASFGILPLSLIISGIVLGFSLKMFGLIDDKFDNKITKSIRQTFVNAQDKIKQGIKNLFKPALGYFFTKKVEPIPAVETNAQQINPAPPMVRNINALPASNHPLPVVSNKLTRTADDQLAHYAKNKSVLFNSSSQRPVLRRTQSMSDLKINRRQPI